MDMDERRPAAALTRLEKILNMPGLQELDLTPFLQILAEAYLDNGNEKRFKEIVDARAEAAAACDDRLGLLDWRRLQAMALTRQGRWKEAERAFDESLPLARAMPFPYAEARILREYAQMRARKGEPDEAKHRLQEALAIFQRLGAKKDIERTDRALAELTLDLLDGVSGSGGGTDLPSPGGATRDAQRI